MGKTFRHILQFQDQRLLGVTQVRTGKYCVRQQKRTLENSHSSSPGRGQWETLLHTLPVPPEMRALVTIQREGAAAAATAISVQDVDAGFSLFT